MTAERSSPKSSRVERLTIEELERRLLADPGLGRDHEDPAFFTFADPNEHVLLPPNAERGLLRAAALPRDAAVVAWRALESESVPLGRLHGRLRELVPAVFANLRHHEDSHGLPRTAKTAYIQRLAKNRLLLDRARPALRRLQQEGMESLVLGGAALSARYPDDRGRHRMTSVPIWVKESDLMRCAAFLQDDGWTPQPHRPHTLTSMSRILPLCRFVQHGMQVGGCIDLHWHLMLQCCSPSSDDNFWGASVPLEVAEVDTRTLCPTDHLFQICGQAEMSRVYQDDASPVWAVDAMNVLKQDQVDWERLVTLAEDHHLALSLGTRLNFLHDTLGASIPRAVLDQLAGWLPTLVERVEESSTVRPDARERRLVNMASHFLRLRRQPRHRSVLIGPLHFLTDFWNLDHAWQVAPTAARRSLRLLRALVQP